MKGDVNLTSARKQKKKMQFTFIMTVEISLKHSISHSGSTDFLATQKNSSGSSNIFLQSLNKLSRTNINFTVPGFMYKLYTLKKES